jgi:hypothetical protein
LSIATCRARTGRENANININWGISKWKWKWHMSKLKILMFLMETAGADENANAKCKCVNVRYSRCIYRWYKVAVMRNPLLCSQELKTAYIITAPAIHRSIVKGMAYCDRNVRQSPEKEEYENEV